MALTSMEARLKMMQERADIQKALAPAQFELAKKMGEKGKKTAMGSFLGQIAPKALDYLIGGGLTLVNPALAASYAAAKPLRSLATGALQKIGMEKGAEYFGGQVDVPEFEGLMKQYLGETASGEKAMRFDRGITESIESQKDLQLGMLEDMVETEALKTGLTTAGKGFLSLLPTLNVKVENLPQAPEATDVADTSIMDEILPDLTRDSTRIASAPEIGGAGKAMVTSKSEGNIIPMPTDSGMPDGTSFEAILDAGNIKKGQVLQAGSPEAMAYIESPEYQDYLSGFHQEVEISNIIKQAQSQGMGNPFARIGHESLLGKTPFAIDDYKGEQYIGGGLVGSGMPSFPPSDPRASKRPIGFSKLIQDLRQVLRRR